MGSMAWYTDLILNRITLPSPPPPDLPKKKHVKMSPEEKKRRQKAYRETPEAKELARIRQDNFRKKREAASK